MFAVIEYTHFDASEFKVFEEIILVKQHLNTIFVVAIKIGPCEFQNHFVARQKFIVALTMNESSSSNVNIFNQTKIANLVIYYLINYYH